MQTPKFSRTYTTLRWTCIILFAIVVVLALIVLVPLFVERVDQWSGWQSGEWAAAGAWLGGTMTFGAVSVAVWQTVRANRQARAAEERADRDIRSRIAADVRSREHAAVEKIVNSATAILTEIYAFKELLDANDKASESMDADVLFPGAYLNTRQHALLRISNESRIGTAYALIDLENRSIHTAATDVMKKMDEAVACYMDTEKEGADWVGATRKAQDMNLANRELQRVAQARFRDADDNFPNPEVPGMISSDSSPPAPLHPESSSADTAAPVITPAPPEGHTPTHPSEELEVS